MAGTKHEQGSKEEIASGMSEAGKDQKAQPKGKSADDKSRTGSQSNQGTSKTSQR